MKTVSNPSTPLVRLAPYILTAAIVLAVHWPVLHSQGLLFDDHEYVADNQLVQNPSWNSASRFLKEVLEPSTVGGYYQPLSMISLMIDYSLGARMEDLRIFHVTNLILHILNTYLVALLLVRLFGTRWIAWAVAVLFAIHPTTVESIAWIAERKTLLATLFTLASLNSYLIFVKRKATITETKMAATSTLWYFVSLLLFLLALASKPTCTPLPALLLLLDLWPLRRFNRLAILEKLPFFALAVVSAIITVISQSRTAFVTHPSEYPPWAIPLFVCHNVVFYLEKIFWPAHLTAFYAYPKPFTLTHPAILTGLIGTIVLFATLAISLKWTRAWAIGYSFFFVAIFPTMGVVGFTQVIAADRFLYLPILGICLIVAWLAIRWSYPYSSKAPNFPSCNNPPSQPLNRVNVIAISSLLAACALGEAVRTRSYFQTWESSEKLFSYLAMNAPDSAVVQRGLGNALKRDGRIDEAIERFRKSIELGDDAGAHNNLAVLLAGRGKMDEALEHCQRAAELAPRWATTHCNLGTALTQKGRYEEAIKSYQQAIVLKPEFAGAYTSLGTVYAKMGQYQKAVENYAQSATLQPKLAITHNNWGDSLLNLQNPAEAESHFRKAIELDSKFVAAHVGLGQALSKLGRKVEAKRSFETALSLDPKNAEARQGLAALITTASASQPSSQASPRSAGP